MTDHASYTLTGDSIPLAKLAELSAAPCRVTVAPEAAARMRLSRAAVE